MAWKEIYYTSLWCGGNKEIGNCAHDRKTVFVTAFWTFCLNLIPRFILQVNLNALFLSQ